MYEQTQAERLRTDVVAVWVHPDMLEFPGDVPHCETDVEKLARYLFLGRWVLSG